MPGVKSSEEQDGRKIWRRRFFFVFVTMHIYELYTLFPRLYMILDAFSVVVLFHFNPQ